MVNSPHLLKTGIALSPEGKLYIADGANIRQVDERGVITTLVGHQRHRSNWRPLPCEGDLPAAEVQLNWPTELAVSPLDGALHFVDDGVVLKLTGGGEGDGSPMRVSIVAGRPLHCPPLSASGELFHRHFSGNSLARS